MEAWLRVSIARYHHFSPGRFRSGARFFGGEYDTHGLADSGPHDPALDRELSVEVLVPYVRCGPQSRRGEYYEDHPHHPHRHRVRLCSNRVLHSRQPRQSRSTRGRRFRQDAGRRKRGPRQRLLSYGGPLKTWQPARTTARVFAPRVDRAIAGAGRCSRASRGGRKSPLPSSGAGRLPCRSRSGRCRERGAGAGFRA